MADTAIYEHEIVEREVGPPLAGFGGTPFSWSAAIAGVFAATAVSFIIIALGSGIGLSFASPYGAGPSVATLTIAAAVWLVMAEAMGFATGGYLAARLRSPAYDAVVGETKFRDAAQGLVVWALGVVAMAVVTGGLALFGAGAGAHIAAAALTGADAASASESASTAPTGYFVDLMFRPTPAAASPAGAGSSATVGISSAGAQPLSNETRAEVTRILVRGVAQGKLDDNDRAYLAQLVSARSGLPADEAQQRVAMVESDARQAVKETADKAAKAGAYFSFWIFMALLFGGTAATLAGILGGELRDAEGRLAEAD